MRVSRSYLPLILCIILLQGCDQWTTTIIQSHHPTDTLRIVCETRHHGMRDLFSLEEKAYVDSPRIFLRYRRLRDPIHYSYLPNILRNTFDTVPRERIAKEELREYSMATWSFQQYQQILQGLYCVEVDASDSTTWKFIYRIPPQGEMIIGHTLGPNNPYTFFDAIEIYDRYGKIIEASSRSISTVARELKGGLYGIVITSR